MDKLEVVRQADNVDIVVRKSSRAHASVDYAGLHEGKLRTAVDVPEHHYIKPIKDGTLELQPESFPRMRADLVTLEYFEKGGGMTEPILVPAELNPRPARKTKPVASEVQAGQDPADQEVQESSIRSEDDFHQENSYDCVFDEGQDCLDMVIPPDLTVRQVAELYGPEEKVEVIDVKLQEGEDRRWNMHQWVDYYEADGEKPVRNVISLEVSQSKLGRLIKRPRIVRQLDLQDSVWPQEETAKGIYPKVQFYCLMSVADCFTDFHIDFGGSSVYYHILRGRKTFFFIPPRPRNLKKYEEWCLSPDQNSTFLGNETKECYRVDLYEGDTMLIPSGWIHAVWTPENSLVIGGNFLTRMHYGMQIQINDIEKNTGVARKFRYPYFQRVLWLAVVQYLEQDPLPASVVDRLSQGEVLVRSTPVYQDFDGEAESSEDPEFFNARFYSEGEIEGLPDLLRYVHRTVLISLGKVPGVQKSTQDAVMRSMPKGCGSHVELVQTFAMWVAWKRGNEQIPSWAHPGTGALELELSLADKKPTAAAQRRMDRQAAHEAFKSARSLRPTLKQEPASSAILAPICTALPQSPVADVKVTSSSDGIQDSQPVKKLPRFGVMPAVTKAPSPAPSTSVIPPGSSIVPVQATAGLQNAKHLPPANTQSTFVGVVINKDTAEQKPTTPQPEGPPTVQPPVTSPSTTESNPASVSQANGQQSTVHVPKRPKNRACSDCKKTKVSFLICVPALHQLNSSSDAVFTMRTVRSTPSKHKSLLCQGWRTL